MNGISSRCNLTDPGHNAHSVQVRLALQGPHEDLWILERTNAGLWVGERGGRETARHLWLHPRALDTSLYHAAHGSAGIRVYGNNIAMLKRAAISYATSADAVVPCGQFAPHSLALGDDPWKLPEFRNFMVAQDVAMAPVGTATRREGE